MTSPRVSDESERMSAGQDGEPRPCLNVPGFLTQITDQPLDIVRRLRGDGGGAGTLRVFKQGGWLGGKLGVALREEERWEDGKG